MAHRAETEHDGRLESQRGSHDNQFLHALQLQLRYLPNVI
jgi:hypothetical protein